jgi:hypothetical protein
MSEPCTDKWHGTDKCPTCGMEDTGYDRGFRDGAARVAPSDGLREAAEKAARFLEQSARMLDDYPARPYRAHAGALRAALATTGQPRHDEDCVLRPDHAGPCYPPAAQPEDTRTADPGALAASEAPVGLQERIGDIEPKLTHEGIVWVPYETFTANDGEVSIRAMMPMTEAGRAMLRDPMYRFAEGHIAAIEREAVLRFLDTAEPKVAEALRIHDSGNLYFYRQPDGSMRGLMDPHGLAATIAAHLRATVEGT